MVGNGKVSAGLRKLIEIADIPELKKTLATANRFLILKAPTAGAAMITNNPVRSNNILWS
uniref:Uncharacterized protein n=1 Tax=Salmonella sp. TaxID=599 RepID=A0A482EW93_SALSP|nr:hypothetical protein [Salmonella sp.]QBM91559.1 hypothetical protein NNIBIDOC_00233 [Salmonella sp.]